MNDQKTKKLVLAALFAALCCVLTMVVQIPVPATGGYVNLGDCAVLLAGWMLGPLYGGAAAGVGSMLADLFSGYAYFAPGTFAVKLLMAVAAALIFRAVHGRRDGGAFVPRAVSALAAETIMVLGYFAYEGLILGYGMGAVGAIPGNLIQGGFGLVASVLLAQALARSRAAGHALS